MRPQAFHNDMGDFVDLLGSLSKSQLTVVQFNDKSSVLFLDKINKFMLSLFNSPHKSVAMFSNNGRSISWMSLKVKFKYRTFTTDGHSRKFTLESLLQDKSKCDKFNFSNASYEMRSIELLLSFSEMSRRRFGKSPDCNRDSWLLLRSRYCRLQVSLKVVLSMNLIALWLALSTWREKYLNSDEGESEPTLVHIVRDSESASKRDKRNIKLN